MPVIQHHTPVPQSHKLPQRDVPPSSRPRSSEPPRRPSSPPSLQVQDASKPRAISDLEAKPQQISTPAPSTRRSPSPSAPHVKAPVNPRAGAESPPPPSQQEKVKADEYPDIPDTSKLSLIDMETFTQILELDEDEETHDFSRPMVWEYFDQAVKTFKEMDDAITAKGLAELSALGHFLKGSSAALGLSRVQDSCERIQHYGHLRDEELNKDLSPAEALDRITKTMKRVKIDYRDAQVWLIDFFGDEEPDAA